MTTTMRRSMLATVGLLCLTTALHAQDRPGELRPARPELLRLQRPVVPGATGGNRLDLDVPVLAGGAPFVVQRLGSESSGLDAIAIGGLSDVRLYDGAGREVPYLLVTPPTTEPTWANAALLPVARTDSTSAFEADIGSAPRIDRMRVGGIPAPFLKRLRLEGSGDREHWTLLVDEGTLFDLPDEGLRQLDLEFTPGEYRYLRVTWDDRRSGRVPMPASVRVRLAGSGGAAAPRLRVSIPVEKRASEPRVSRYRLRLPGAHLPIIALELSVAGGNVLRDARVSEPRLLEGQVLPVALGQARLRRAVRGDLAASSLRIPISAPREAELDLVVDDGDNPPLAITGVTAVFATLPYIYFEAPSTAPLVARYGGERIAPPQYDLEAARDRVPNLALTPARWGDAREAAPAKVAEASPLPAIGAPIDVRAFRWKRAIPEGPRGLTAVKLDAAALAHSRRFPDLRIAGADARQVPYLLERLDEPLTLDLGKIVEAPPLARGTDAPAGGGAVSRYRITLPYASLPESRLVLATSARVFQRSVSVEIEHPAGGARRDPWSQRILRATWSHADPETPAPALTLQLPAAGTSDLVLVVDEGDNSRLPLDSMTLLLPAYRVRFVRDAAAPLTLYYGREDLESPTYDLALLAPRLLGAPATGLTAGPEQPVTPPAMSALPMRLFWVILGLAVAAMLALIARLVVKGAPDDDAMAEAEQKTA